MRNEKIDLSEYEGNERIEKELQSNLIQSVHRFKKEKIELLFKDISQKEFFMMEIIKHHSVGDKQGIQVSKLANKLQVSTPAVSRMLGGLEDHKYVIRTIDPQDRRNIYVNLTEEGMQIIKESEKNMDVFTGNVIRKMGYDKVELLIDLFNKFVDAMEIELKNEIESGNLKKQTNEDVES